MDRFSEIAVDPSVGVNSALNVSIDEGYHAVGDKVLYIIHVSHLLQ